MERDAKVRNLNGLVLEFKIRTLCLKIQFHLNEWLKFYQ
jgi:hypothetical protein